MAGEDNKTTFVLDLDVKEFTEKGLQAKGVIESIGDSEGMTELLEKLTNAAPLLAAAGVAALAFKKAIDLTVEAEELQRIDRQFDILSQKAGIAPAKLKEGLEEASLGLISTNDLMAITNESLVKLQGGAEKLPEILTLAMKATQVFGGNAQENFQAISNAIANGNTRMLKHYGIVIDATDAQKKFAAANGATAETLSAAGKQQALLNAVLEQGNNAFKGIDVDLNQAKSTLQSLKTTFTDIGEVATLAFEKMFGNSVRTSLQIFNGMLHTVKDGITLAFGSETEKASINIKSVQAQVKQWGNEIERLQTLMKSDVRFQSLEKQKELNATIDSYKKKIAEAGVQVQQLDSIVAKGETAKIAAVHKNTAESLIDLEKKKKAEVAFESEREKLDKQYTSEMQKNVNTRKKIDDLVQKELLVNEQKHAQAIKAIQASTSLDEIQKGELLVLENKRFDEAKENQDKASLALRIKLLKQYAENSKDIFNGIGAVFQANALQAEDDLNNLEKQGQIVFSSLKDNATGAFESIGTSIASGKDIAKSTADAMAAFFLKSIGQIATAEGSLMLAKGIGNFNPVQVIEGGALIALGAALGAAAGSISSSTSTAITPVAIPSSPINSGVTTPPRVIPPVTSTSKPNKSYSDETQNDFSSPSFAVPNMAAQQGPVQRTVTVNIAGNYLETDQTRQMLMNLIRQESDATGFNYNQIGA